MKYPAYPKYKDSGVEWLGEVPEHWEITRISYISNKVGSGKTPRGGVDNYKSEGVMLIRSQNVYDDGLRLEDVVCIDNDIDEEMADTRVCGNDVLLNITGASIGRCALVPDRFIKANVNQHVCIIRPQLAKVNSMFLQNVVVSNITKSQIISFENGSSREGLNFQQVRALALLLPPLPEQRTIAAFLDAQTSKLDTLIAKKRELIEKLKEKRAALITRTVTRGLPPDAAKAAGLDPHPKMKDSGVEWLGEVPEHWEVKRLKHYIQNLNSGASVNSDNMPTEDDSPGILKTSCVYGDVFRPEENKRVVEEEINRVFCPVFGDSLIISRMNTPELVGSCGYVAQDLTNLYLPDRLWITKFANKKMSFPKFFWYRIISRDIKEQISSLATGTSGSMKNLMQESFLSIAVAIPSLSEQRAIAAYLDRETAAIDALVAKVEAAIDRLQEYRAALITAAVTGQIDVRNFPSEAA